MVHLGYIAVHAGSIAVHAAYIAVHAGYILVQADYIQAVVKIAILRVNKKNDLMKYCIYYILAWQHPIPNILVSTPQNILVILCWKEF